MNKMLEINKIYNQNCLEGMRNLQDNSINLILADYPYNISRSSGYTNTKLKKYSTHSIDFGDWDKSEIDLEESFRQFYRVLKPSGSVIFFYDVFKFQNVKEIAENLKFKQCRIGVWIKTNPVPINSKLNYLSNHSEYFLSFVKGSNPTFNSEYDNGYYNFPICHGKERTEHPTQKPLKLIESLILKHSNPSDIILDPTIGSGTTIVGCINTNRNYIGFETDENYFKIANNRIQEVLENKQNGLF